MALGTAAVLAAAGCGNTHAAGTAAPAATWRYLPGASGSPGMSTVAGSGSGDVWALGTTTGGATKGDDGNVNTVGLHFDGTAWRTVHLPGVKDDTGLTDLAVDAPNDAWAVGADSKILVDHFDGHGWTSSQPLGRGSANAVAAASPADVWLAATLNPGPACTKHGGCVSSVDRDRPLIAHFDGHRWIRTGGLLDTDVHVSVNTLDALGPDDVWAAGSWQVNTHTDYDEQPLIAHWNGHTWTRFTLPQQSAGGTVNGLVSDGGNGLWAVGNQGDVSPFTSSLRPYLLHFNGTGWSRVPTTSLKVGLGSAAPDGHGGLWTLDDTFTTGSGGSRGLHHFSGGHWTTVTPSGTPAGTSWRAISTAGSQLWVTGSSGSGSVAFATLSVARR